MASEKARSRAPKTKDKYSSQALGALFRERRLAAGQSEEAACEYLGKISKERLRRFEEGVEAMPVWVIYGLSNFLNISPREVQSLLNESGSALNSKS